MNRFLLPVVLLVACASRPQEASIPLDGHTALGPSIRVENLEVWPVLSDEAPEVGVFLTLEQAQRGGDVVIREQADAQVASLVIENRGDVPILACAGTVVTGGRQDRQLGEDVVIDGGTSVTVRCFCVEPGRWDGDESFRAVELAAPRSVRAAGQYEDDQQRVWHDVDIVQDVAVTPRRTYAAVLETRSRRRPVAERILAHLRDRDGLVGYAYAVDGRPAGIRTFAHREILEPRLAALVFAMCAEAEQGRVVADVANSEESVAAEAEQRRSGVGNADPGENVAALLRRASDEYDRGDYDGARASAESALRIEPGNRAAAELARIARETRYLADRNAIREEFGPEWRAIMEQICYCSLADAEPLAAAPADVPSLFRALNEGAEELRPTSGANRNGYSRSAAGYRSACYVQTNDGRWIPLTRDWTARSP